MNDERKPLARVMESLVPKSVRLTPSEWDAIEEIARARALEPAVFIRTIITTVVSIARVPALTEAPVGVLGAAVGAAQVLGGAHLSPKRGAR